MKRVGIVVLAAVAIFAACFALRETKHTTPSNSGATGPTADSAPAPSGAVPTVTVPGLPTADAPAQSAPSNRTAAGDSRLQKQLGLQAGGQSDALAQMAEYSREELDLFAQVQRVTGNDPSPELREVVQRRRDGATRAELDSLINQKLSGDVLARATVLRWLDRYGPSDDPAGAPQPSGEPQRAPVAPITPK